MDFQAGRDSVHGMWKSDLLEMGPCAWDSRRLPPLAALMKLFTLRSSVLLPADALTIHQRKPSIPQSIGGKSLRQSLVSILPAVVCWQIIALAHRQGSGGKFAHAAADPDERPRGVSR